MWAVGGVLRGVCSEGEATCHVPTLSSKGSNKETGHFSCSESKNWSSGQMWPVKRLDFVCTVFLKKKFCHLFKDLYII